MMKQNKHVFRFAAVFLLLQAIAFVKPGAAQTYDFDRNRSEVDFTYYVGPAGQTAQFSEMSGTFEFDAKNPQRCRLRAAIKTASLSASHWESVLKGSDFFDVGAWPEIRFQSLGFRPVAKASFEVSGNLTLRGVTKPIKLTLSAQPSKPATAVQTAGAVPGGEMTLIADTHIQRSDFGMTALSLFAGDEITIHMKANLRERR